MKHKEDPMNQQQLIFIRQIARTGSIRVAAACVDRNPSTLTRGFKNVENELGC
jgi:DNA-binding transcriptional LysR family regulator